MLDNTCEDIPTPPSVPLSGKYIRSFAYVTIKDRLPVILTKIIDQLCRDKEKLCEEYGEEAKEELKSIIGFFSKLKNEMQTNKVLIHLACNEEDTPLWNTSLQELQNSIGKEPKWFETPWLYVECYFYRRIKEGFVTNKCMKNFDPFCSQKQNALLSSLEAISILAQHMTKVVQDVASSNQPVVKKELMRLIEVNLWGNKCDLSISVGLENSQKIDPLEQLSQLEKFILVNDAENIWEVLTTSRNEGKEVVVDLVLDNAGFELYTDFCLAEFLCSFGLADKIRFYVKAIPWFVSDALVPDIHWTISSLIKASDKSDSSVDCELVQSLAEKWKSYVAMGKWTIEEETFWTLPYDYSRMKEIDRKLYSKLSEANLVIFKGDLNYRKLVGDINWDTTEIFTKCLRGFHPAKLISLRTLKADVVVGLKPGQGDELSKLHPNWMISGEFAVVQFCSDIK